jgi:hypothetical protein
MKVFVRENKPTLTGFGTLLGLEDVNRTAFYLFVLSDLQSER